MLIPAPLLAEQNGVVGEFAAGIPANVRAERIGFVGVRDTPGRVHGLEAQPGQDAQGKRAGGPQDKAGSGRAPAARRSMQAMICAPTTGRLPTEIAA